MNTNDRLRNNRKIISLLVLLLTPFMLSAQNNLRFFIYDAEDHQPVPFANVFNMEGKLIASSDVDGKFELNESYNGTSIKIRSIGYKERTLVLDAKKSAITLQPEENVLTEVEILPGENPAHRLIEAVIRNRKINDPEQNIPFTYNSYNKLVFFFNADSAAMDAKQMSDSGTIKALQYSATKHLFMTESVTERKYIPPDKSKEIILASKVSGFANPDFSMLATQLQSFSFYNDYVSLLSVKYLSPVSPGSTKKYLFLMEDTVYKGNDTIYTISFTPRKGKSFKGMKGFVNVSTNGYAIESIKAEPAIEEGTLGIKIHQLHTHYQNKQWFPLQLNAKLYLPLVNINNFYVEGEARGYINNIVLNPGLNKKDFDEIDLEVDPASGQRDPEFLNQYRNDTLNLKEKETYRFIDSLGEAEKLDEKVKLFTELAQGYVPWGYIKFDLKHLLRYNQYEGLRLGMGLRTSNKLSHRFSFGGYGAYGFQDKAPKYGGDIHVNFWPRKQLTLDILYKNDLVEAGAPPDFYEPLTFLSPSQTRQLYVVRYDKVEMYETRVGIRMLRHFKFTVFGNVQLRTPKFLYDFSLPLNEDILIRDPDYLINELGFNIRFAFREKFIFSGNTLISKGTNWPVLNVKITKGIKDIYNGEYTYDKVDMKLSKSFLIRNLGRLNIEALAGQIQGNLPYSLLYAGKSSFGRLGISSPNSFETMRMNEFLSDQYVNFFFSHNFLSNLFHFKKFQPQLELMTSVGYGSLKYPERHEQIDFKTMEKGYFESGFRLNNVIKSKFSAFGIGVFYRYGAYALPVQKENFAIKITTGFAVE